MVRKPSHPGRHIRRAGLGILCTVALGALTAGNAFAAHSPHWVVNGTTFTEAESVQVDNTTPIRLELPKFATISCETVSASGTILSEYEFQSTGGPTFGDCTVPAAAVCTVRSPGQSVGTIKFEPIKSELIGVGESVYQKFTTWVGDFFELEVLGSECSFAGKWPIAGSIAAERIGPPSSVAPEWELSRRVSEVTGAHLRLGEKELFVTGRLAWLLVGANAAETWGASL